MAESIHLFICQALVELLRRQLYQAPVSKHLLASKIVSGFGDCIWDGSPVGAVIPSDGHSFSFGSTFCLCNSVHGYFVSPSKKDRSIHTLAFLLLEFHVFCKLYLGYSKFLDYYLLISDCISCVFFCDCVTLLSMISSRSIHLPHLGLHPINIHQTQTLLWMPTSAC